jgi:hypothetical protein
VFLSFSVGEDINHVVVRVRPVSTPCRVDDEHSSKSWPRHALHMDVLYRKHDARHGLRGRLALGKVTFKEFSTKIQEMTFSPEMVESIN